jgi:hypothetical protein
MVIKPVRLRPPGPLPFTERDSGIETRIHFPPGLSFPFLRLPPEIRRKIYRMLFRSTVPIYPIISIHSCDVFERFSFPTDFLRTNRQIHAEASAVLWGDSQIVFQFPLNWNLEYNQCRGERRPPWFVKRETFMPSPEHLHQIRNLVIEVYLMRSSRSRTVNTLANKPAFPSRTVRKQLTAFLRGNADWTSTTHTRDSIYEQQPK